MLEYDDFEKDAPWSDQKSPRPIALATERIAGLVVQPIVLNTDARGSLSELLTTRDGEIEPLVHVYAVQAAPGSERALVYHAKQKDRLAFLQGRFRIILQDLREDEPTHGNRLCFDVGSHRPCLLTIPQIVAHGVKNVGEGTAMFVNMPTRPFFRGDPDKFRVQPDRLNGAITFEAVPEF